MCKQFLIFVCKSTALERRKQKFDGIIEEIELISSEFSLQDRILL